MVAGGLGLAGVASLVTDLTRGPEAIYNTAGAGPQIDASPALGYPLEPVRGAGMGGGYPLAGESGALHLSTPLQGSATVQLGGPVPVDIGSNITRLPNHEMTPPDKRGNAPFSLKDGQRIEIHHQNQNPNGPFIEMHRTDHRGAGNDLLNHPNKTKPSLIDRIKFKNDVRRYWTQEWDRGRWIEQE